MKKTIFLTVLIVLAVSIFSTNLGLVHALPDGIFGAQVDPQDSTTSPISTATHIDALAGNITLFNIEAVTKSRGWAGFTGNITGLIILSDGTTGTEHFMYNWTQASPRGQVYASTAGAGAPGDVDWGNLECFNFTADGTNPGIVPGGTDATNGTNDPYAPGDLDARNSVTGMNAHQINTLYGFEDRDVDSINETFKADGVNDGADNNNNDHEYSEFYVGNIRFPANQCPGVEVYNSTGPSSNFQEALLYDPTNNQPLFTGLIAEDRNGYDGNTHDFEMLVPNNQHGSNTDLTRYYIYAEIK